MLKQQAGVTLVELMVVIILLAILATLGMPLWHEFIERNRSQAILNALERSIQQARSIAVSQRTRIEVCGASAQHQCQNNWQQGWLLRLSNNTDEIIQITELSHSEIKLIWAGFQPRIVFHPSGITSMSNGRFVACRKQRVAWQLILNRQGRLRRATASENRSEDHRCG